MTEISVAVIGHPGWGAHLFIEEGPFLQFLPTPNSVAGWLTLRNSLFFIGAMLVFLAVSLKFGYAYLRDSALRELQEEVLFLTADFDSKIDELRRDTKFLSTVPPIQGILRAAQNDGVDPKDQSSAKQWKTRLVQIFQEILAAKEEYLQVRYIGVADGGKELVRVERDSGIIRIRPEAQLQQKAQEPYFKAITEYPRERIYLSEFTLNREWGHIVEPRQLVIRAAISIYDQHGQIFGFIIINMLAEKLLSGLMNIKHQGKSVRIVDQKGASLISAMPEVGSMLTEAEILSNPIVAQFLKEPKRGRHGVIELPLRDQLVAATKVYYNPGDSSHYLGVFLTTPSAKVENGIWDQLKLQAMLLVLLLVIKIAFSYLHTKSLLAPLKNLKDQARDFAKGKQITVSPDILERRDEIAELGKTIDQMGAEIERKTELLKFQTQALDQTALVSQTDGRGRITYANEKFCEISGYTLDELVGSDHRIVNSKHHPKEFFADMWRTISAGKAWRGEICNLAKNGSLYWVDSAIVPFKTGAGRIERYISIRYDITDKKRQEAKLKEKSVAKDRFFATMSHEIRTPLGAVIGLNEILASTELSERQQELVGNMASSSSLLLQIINDILDLSKFESGKIDLNPEPTRVEDITKGLIQTMREKALEKGLSFDISVSSDVPQYVLVDTLRLKQVLINLTSNAIKFTSAGEVSVSVCAKHVSADNNMLRFCVADTGIGLSPEQIKMIFDEYRQADSTTTKKFGGTGLGLAICQRIVAAMGGKIWVESALGMGSRFYVEIACQSCSQGKYLELGQEEEHDLIYEVSKQKPKILLAEDYALNREIFRNMMGDLGFEAHVVDNGQRALEECRRNHYDLVFLDVQMPIMDGVTACQKIREHHENHGTPQPWIVALTANVFREDREQYFRAAFSDFLPKPFTRRSLRQGLTNFGTGRSSFREFTGDENTYGHSSGVTGTNSIVAWDLLESAVGDDQEAASTMLATLFSDIKENVIEAETCTDNQDLARLFEVAHSGKGNSANFGLLAVSEVFQRIESDAKSGNTSSTNHALQNLRTVLGNSEELVAAKYPNLKNSRESS